MNSSQAVSSELDYLRVGKIGGSILAAIVALILLPFWAVGAVVVFLVGLVTFRWTKTGNPLQKPQIAFPGDATPGVPEIKTF